MTFFVCMLWYMFKNKSLHLGKSQLSQRILFKSKFPHLGQWCLISIVSFPKLFRKKEIYLFTKAVFQSARITRETLFKCSLEVFETKHLSSHFNRISSLLWLPPWDFSFHLHWNNPEKPQTRQHQNKSYPCAFMFPHTCSFSQFLHMESKAWFSPEKINKQNQNQKTTKKQTWLPWRGPRFS